MRKTGHAKKPQRGVKLKHEYNQADFTDWDLDALDAVIGGFHDAVYRAVSEAIMHVFKDDDTRIDWPAIWGDHGDGRGKDKPVDPLMVYLTLPIGKYDEHPVFSFNLRTPLKDIIEECRSDGSFSDGLTRIKDALRELADEIESALNRGADHA